MSGGREEASDAAGSVIRVLCVDDELEVAELTARQLERADEAIESEIATGGNEALDRLAKTEIDCVVSDHRMPEMDGLELLAAVRERAPDLPFVLFTARGDEHLASEAISAGVTDYVPKRSNTSQYGGLADRIRHTVECSEIEKRKGRTATAEDYVREHPPDRVDEEDRGRASGWDPTDAALLGELFDALPVGVAVRRADGQFVALNDCAASILAVGPGDRRGAATTDGEPSGGLAPDSLPLDIVLGADEPVEERVGAGPHRQYLVRAVPFDGPGQASYVGYVVTEVGRKRVADGVECTDDHDWTGSGRRDATDGGESDAYLERQETIVQTVQDGVYTLGSEGRFTFANEAFVEMTQFDSPEELQGEHISTLLPDEQVEAGQRRIEELLTGERDAVSFEMTIPSESGELATYDVKITLLPAEDGAFRGSIGVVRDITELKERERELELYERIVDSAPDVIYALDTDRRFTVVNRFLTEIVGRSKMDMIGEHIELLAQEGVVDRANLDAGLEAMEQVIEGEADQVRFETEFTVEDIEGVAENILTRLDVDGDPYGVVNVVRDVTDRRAHERELERQNERLEEFASIVSHDLRNPLTAARGYLDLARESNDPEDYKKVEHAHDRMEELTDGLLTLARNGQSVEETQPVDLASACERAWATVDSSSAALSVTVDDVTVDADPERLRALLENLFSNAVEHGSIDRRTQSDEAVEHGQHARDHGVAVEVGMLTGEAGFYVADDGPGIPENDLEEVFERGYSTDQAGTGFGLAIVRSIAEAHGWKVTATASKLGGARFEVRTGPTTEPLGAPS